MKPFNGARRSTAPARGRTCSRVRGFERRRADISVVYDRVLVPEHHRAAIVRALADGAFAPPQPENEVSRRARLRSASPGARKPS